MQGNEDWVHKNWCELNTESGEMERDSSAEWARWGHKPRSRRLIAKLQLRMMCDQWRWFWEMGEIKLQGRSLGGALWRGLEQTLSASSNANAGGR